MREKIITLLKNSDKALSIYEIQDSLKIKEVEEVKLLNESYFTLIFDSIYQRYFMDEWFKR